MNQFLLKVFQNVSTESLDFTQINLVIDLSHFEKEDESMQVESFQNGSTKTFVFA